MAAYFFASPIDVDIKLEGEELRKQVEIKSDKDKNITCPVYYDGDSVTGQVRFLKNVSVLLWGWISSLGNYTSARWEEDNAWWNKGGIRWQYWFVNSSIFLTNSHSSFHFKELFYDRGHHHEFLSLSQELAAPGELRQAQTFDFSFKNVEKQFESYQGINVKLRYVHWLLARSYDMVVVIRDVGILYEYSSREEWRKSSKKRISGFTHSECLLTAITQ